MYKYRWEGWGNGLPNDESRRSQTSSWVEERAREVLALGRIGCPIYPGREACLLQELHTREDVRR